MRKIFVTPIVCIMLIANLTACSPTPTANLSNADVNELLDRIDELEDENADLKKQISKINVQDQALSEQETWTDDTLVPFTDPEMVDLVRNTIGNTSSDITYGQVKNITELSFDWVGNIEPLKYFTGLTKLKIKRNDTATNLQPLGYLTNLKKLEIRRPFQLLCKR